MNNTLLGLMLCYSCLGTAAPTPTVLPTPQETYSHKRTYLVDSNQTNNTYLFRGNQPLNQDGTFAYSDMATRFNELAGIDLSKFKIIDLSIIDNTPGSNRGDLADEFYDFGFSSSFYNVTISPSVWPPYATGFPVTNMWGVSVSAKSGSLIWYPVQGCPSLAVCSQQENKYFGFDKEVDFLANFLTSQKNSVLYFHCLHGHDRTSALHAGYLLKYKKATLNQVLTKKPPIGAMGFKHAWEVDYKTLVTWYAGYLTKTAK